LAWIQGKSEGIILWELDLEAEMRTAEGDVKRVRLEGILEGAWAVLNGSAF
jgi:hypothetical protein